MALSSRQRTVHSFRGRGIASQRGSTARFLSSDYNLANRLKGLDQPTVWHEFSPLANEYNSINLGQGFPDWNPPGFVLKAMDEALYKRDANQYARSFAHMPLAQALCDEYGYRWNRNDLDPATNVATATGVTNVLYCALQGMINPGDEVLLLEPAFDIYASQVKMAGGTCVYCPLRPNMEAEGASKVFTLNLDELRSKITDKTKVLLVNTPHNPTGKIFSLEELRGIAKIVMEHPELVVISDEVYEHLIFDKENEPHLSIANIDAGLLWDRTLTLSSSGKTFSCTGWKVGWAIGPPHLVKAVTAVQQWVNFSPVTPTQDAIAQALPIARNEKYEGFDNFYDYLAHDYKVKRELLRDALSSAGMTSIIPSGAFFIMADTRNIQFPYKEILAETPTSPALPAGMKMPRDWALSRWLTKEVGVTAIPPSAFYTSENVPLADNLLRFAFCKQEPTLREAKMVFENYFRGPKA